jgi:hypothetical protein
MRLGTLALSLFCTTACATVTSIQTAPLGAGDLLHFRAPFDSVTAAAPSAVERAGPELRDTAQVDSATYRAIGTTPFNVLRFGEVVRVLVERRTDDAVAVRIFSQSRWRGGRGRDWTRSIYRELDRGLGSGSVTAVPGSRIRLFQLAPGAKPILGTLERWESDTLRLVAQASAGATAIPLTTLHRLQVSRGARGNAPLGGVIGGLLGLAVGMVIRSSSDCQQGFLEFCMGKALAPMAGMAVGGGLGAVVGASIRTDQWWEVRLPAAASPSRWR